MTVRPFRSWSERISGCTKNSFMLLSPPITMTTSWRASEAIAQLGRVRREERLHLQAARREHALVDADVQRQVLRTREHLDPDRLEVLRDRETRCEQAAGTDKNRQQTSC